MMQSGTARHASAHSTCPRRPVGTTKHATHRTNVMNAHRIPFFRVVGAVPGATTAEGNERTCARSEPRTTQNSPCPCRFYRDTHGDASDPQAANCSRMCRRRPRRCMEQATTITPHQHAMPVKSYLLGKMYGFTMIIMAAGSCTLVLSTPGTAQLCSYCAAALVRCAQTTTVAVKMRHHNHRNRQVLPAATPTMVPLPRNSPSALSRDLPFFCSGLLSPEVSRVARVWNQPPHL